MPGKRFTEYQKEIAFDRYYVMEPPRDLKVLSLSLSDTPEFKGRAPAHVTLRKWSVSHNWQDRIKQRDIENAQKKHSQTDRAVVNTKADYRKDIRLALQPVKAMINKVIVVNKQTGVATLKIDMKDAKDIGIAVSSLEKLMKLDLVLMGEADSRMDSQIQLIMGNQVTEEDI